MAKDQPQQNHHITDSQIADALKRSGYLMEQRVEHFLQKQGYHIRNDNFFVDDDTKKLREIDLIAENEQATRKSGSRKFGGVFTYQLICECENNSQPVVFFPSKAKNPYGAQGLIFTQIPYSFAPKDPELLNIAWGDTPFFNRKVFKAHHLSGAEIATQYCNLSPKDKGKPTGEWMASHLDEQHSTLTNLLKGSLFLAKRDSFYQEQNMSSYNGKYQINLYYPVLILQNRLMIATEKSNGEIELEDREHVVFMRNHRSEEWEHLLMIDVIQEKYLPKYVKMVQQEVHLMHSRILEHPYLGERIESWEKDYRNLQAERAVNAVYPYP